MNEERLGNSTWGWPPGREAIAANVRAALGDESWYAYEGRWTIQLREQLKRQFACRHVRLTCSGTFAVEQALRGLRVGSGDEVIMAAYDFPGNFRAVESVGATPVLVDIEADGWTLDPDQLPAAVTKKTRAVLISHLHGQLADMPAIAAWCDGHGIALVEDACQVPGAVIAGRPAGGWGDVATLSFGGSKLLTAGRGGAVLCSDDATYQRMAIFSDRGNDAFPLSQLQAAVLLPQLDLLTDYTRRRAEGAETLRGHFASSSSVQLARARPADWVPAYYKFGFMLSGADEVMRDDFVARASDEGIPIGAGFRGFFLRSDRRCRKIGALPHARVAAASTVLLHHVELLATEERLEQVARLLTELSESSG